MKYLKVRTLFNVDLIYVLDCKGILYLVSGNFSRIKP